MLKRKRFLVACKWFDRIEVRQGWMGVPLEWRVDGRSGGVAAGGPYLPLLRVAQHLAGNASVTWHMVVADDYCLGGLRQTTAVRATSFLLALRHGRNVKVIEPDSLESPSAVQNGCRDGRQRPPSPTGHSFEEGLERITYVTGALEHERPFLEPLCRFLTLHHVLLPPSSV